MRINGYFLGKRTEYASLEDAWTCGSQMVCISRTEFKPQFADISSDEKFQAWLNSGLATGIFRYATE